MCRLLFMYFAPFESSIDEQQVFYFHYQVTLYAFYAQDACFQ